MGFLYAMHQGGLILSSLVGMAAAGYVAITSAYNFENNLKISATRVVIYGFLFILSFILLLVTFFGVSHLVRLFGLLGSFAGSGLYVIYLGILVSYHTPGYFGTIGSLFCVVVGTLSILLSLTWREKDSSGYRAIITP